MSSAKSIESMSDTKSMITAISESLLDDDDDRAVTPMEGDDSVIVQFIFKIFSKIF